MICAQGWVQWRDEGKRGDAVLGAEGKKGKDWRKRGERQGMETVRPRRLGGWE